MHKHLKRLLAALCCLVLPPLQSLAQGAVDDADPDAFEMRPNPSGEWALGQIGATGIQARIHGGLRVVVEGTESDTPAVGRFEKGEVILGVNGRTLEGRNPLYILGAALSEAEATDGSLRFEVVAPEGGGTREVEIRIPVLGAYSPTFPLDCAKSEAIVRWAAEFYAGEERLQEHHLLNGLACLFLLSTGDDAHLPRVKAYFGQFLNPDGSAKNVGDNSWHNGPNGVACAEYYLRTGDRSVLPLLQHYVDDARDRQRYGVGWGHWGSSASPAYESGGGMQHAAGTPMLLTLLLGKACGVEVDEDTLVGALRHWYRFVGHGAIPVADQRYWAHLWSAGRDGWTAAVMKSATRAGGDVSIYEKARAHLALLAVVVQPRGFWDLTSQWLGGALLSVDDPGLYHTSMLRNAWIYDLGRQATGGFWINPAHGSLDGIDSGIVMALAYTAPRRTLQITGAPRSPHAVPFSLPERLWGNEADLAFLSVDHHPGFHEHDGDDEEVHLPFRVNWLPHGLRYTSAQTRHLPLEVLRKFVRHRLYIVRSGAAKAMNLNGLHDELERLLRDPDPRLRRAALDGITDCRPWFTDLTLGRHALRPEQYTPAMGDAITAILHDPDEAWFVIEGALLALYNAPVELIEENVPRILAWKGHEDWWLRDAAFYALMGFRNDEQRFARNLPAILDIMIREYPFNPRHRMTRMLAKALDEAKPDSEVRRLIVDGLTRATRESEVLPDVRRYNRSNDGLTNISESLWAAALHAPESASDLAVALAQTGLLESMGAGSLMDIISGRDQNARYRPVGLLPALEQLSGSARERLVEILFATYRPALVSRLASCPDRDRGRLIDMILDLTRLRREVSGWQPIGEPQPRERNWRHRSFDPMKEEERLHPRIGPPRRLREVTLAPDMVGWQEPGYDDGTWNRGLAPVGVGTFTAYGYGRIGADTEFFYPNNSDWGAGEFIAMRTTFELSAEDLAKDVYRIRILSPQGYHIYLNGRKIHSYGWFHSVPRYEEILLGAGQLRHLREGRNTLAVQGLLHYEQERTTGEYLGIGQMDMYIEALDLSDLRLD